MIAMGRAGKLLDEILSKAMGMTRDQTYICNVLKCRPPGNRNPLAEEIQNCTGHLAAQLAVLRPKVICALGRFAAHFLLESTESTYGRPA